MRAMKKWKLLDSELKNHNSTLEFWKKSTFILLGSIVHKHDSTRTVLQHLVKFCVRTVREGNWAA